MYIVAAFWFSRAFVSSFVCFSAWTDGFKVLEGHLHILWLPSWCPCLTNSSHGAMYMFGAPVALYLWFVQSLELHCNYGCAFGCIVMLWVLGLFYKRVPHHLYGIAWLLKNFFEFESAYIGYGDVVAIPWQGMSFVYGDLGAKYPRAAEQRNATCGMVARLGLALETSCFGFTLILQRR